MYMSIIDGGGAVVVAQKCSYSVYPWRETFGRKTYIYLFIYAVADPGFGQGGPNWSGGPTLKREGCTPDFIESYSLLGPKVCSNFGAGGTWASGPPWICY